MQSINANVVLNKKPYTIACAKLCRIISKNSNKNGIGKAKAIDYLSSIFEFLKLKKIHLDDESI